MIINAHCHRNLLDESCIQVAVYDDRLSDFSGPDYTNGLTYEEVMNGHSKIGIKVLQYIQSDGTRRSMGKRNKRILNAAKSMDFRSRDFRI